jgi:16S rRNA (cytosine1402-N4)-methyltransferase
MHQKDQNNTHIPVLVEEALQYLSPQKGDSYLDLTAGYGGHAEAVLECTNNPRQAVLVDRDQNAVENLEAKFKGRGIRILNKDFLQATQELMAEAGKFDVILADLGVSSPHLNIASRGFSLGADGPLDMRMDQRQTLTAGVIINTYPEAKLAEILERYGEEPKARKVAKIIAANRPIETTTQLAHLVARAWPGHSKVHPATRTFQAIRIAVNDELEQIRQGLPLWIDLLSPGGRIAIISFHSLEDRLVKQAFLDASGGGYDATIQILTKHPVTAGEQEIVFNPRARSAKLRAAAKINK